MKSKTVLMIEDDLITSQLNQLLLDEWESVKSYTTERDGLTAIMYLEKCHSKGGFPDLILLDLNMVVMSGLEFLEHYGKNYLDQHPDTKIIILSNRVNDTDKQQALAYGFVKGLINKPLTNDKLQAVLNPEGY
ncbi:MAG: response regulator [Bacteroidota bacterium]